MVEPFEQAKSIWHGWIDNHVDHSFHLSANDPLLAWFTDREPHRLGRMLVTPGDPTTEILTVCMMAKLGAFLAADGGRLLCTSIPIEETPTNTVTFAGCPADYLPLTAQAASWWTRPDLSINDLQGATLLQSDRVRVAAR